MCELKRTFSSPHCGSVWGQVGTRGVEMWLAGKGEGVTTGGKGRPLGASVTKGNREGERQGRQLAKEIVHLWQIH